MITGILGCGGCGGTFLDWTLHFLSGNQTNWVALPLHQKNRSTATPLQQQTIVNNPLQYHTAHAHLRTHPNNISLPIVIDLFRHKSDFPMHSFYYADEMTEDQTTTTHNDIIKLYPDLQFITYQYKDSDIHAIFWLQHEKMAGWAHRYDSVMIGDTSAKISDCAVWDQREMLSMHYPECIRGQTVNEKIVNHSNNYILNFSDFFVDFPSKIDEIFYFLNLKIDITRYHTWLAIYQKWQQGSGTEFYKDLDLIVHCIVNNQHMDLNKYHMTFAKEVVLASKLLFEHNLSLKSFGLDTIDADTKFWHSILETNTYHNLKAIT